MSDKNIVLIGNPVEGEEDHSEDYGWYCEKCKRWHPNYHKECFWCKPTESRAEPPISDLAYFSVNSANVLTSEIGVTAVLEELDT